MVTCVGQGAVTGVGIVSIHTGALVQTGVGFTLIDIDLTVLP